MTVPLSRRAAVLLLLFPDVQGSLRVVLTLRSELLRNFAGQVALPGGKYVPCSLARGSSGELVVVVGGGGGVRRCG